MAEYRKEVLYRWAWHEDMLMKRVIDEEEGVYTYYVWNVAKKEWVENSEVCAGYFIGFESSSVISEDKAEEYKKRVTLKD